MDTVMDTVGRSVMKAHEIANSDVFDTLGKFLAMAIVIVFFCAMAAQATNK